MSGGRDWGKEVERVGEMKDERKMKEVDHGELLTHTHSRGYKKQASARQDLPIIY